VVYKYLIPLSSRVKVPSTGKSTDQSWRFYLFLL